MSLLVSVVVPTFRRNAMLRRCLEALLDQTLDPGAFEIIVVDDAPAEDCRRLVEALGAEIGSPRVRYLANEGAHGPAAARNRGWRAAGGEIIAFTDDDCIPEVDWLARGLAAFRPDTAGVSGRIIVPIGQTPTDYELNTSYLEVSEFATANCFYRKSALNRAGGFDERFTAAWREDADLFFTLLGRNEQLVRSADPIVIHPVRHSPWGASLKEQRKSMFNALLYKKHPALYRQRIGNPVLSYYYVIAFSALVFLLSFRPEFPPLAPPALAVWATTTVGLFLKRMQRTSRSLSHLLEMAFTSLVIPFLSLFWRIAGAVRFNVFYY